MAAIDKAVILAAGRGSRIAAVAGDTPKPLLTLDGRPGTVTFLDWHVRCLAAIGVREIYVVGNRRTYGAALPAIRTARIEWILNPSDDLLGSGSAHSLWFAWNSAYSILDRRSRVAVLDADIVYDPALLDDLVRAPRDRSKTLVASVYQQTGEEVLVFADRSDRTCLRFHGKGLLRTCLVDGCTCLGEATGILLWEPQDHELLRSITEWTIRCSSAGARSEHEDVTQQMMSLHRLAAVCFGPERAFLEVDTPEDYRLLVDEIYPRVQTKVPPLAMGR